MALPEKPITRKEQYLARVAGQESVMPDKPVTREEMYLDEIAKNSGGTDVEANPEESASESLKKVRIDDTVYSIPQGGGGGGGTSDYVDLENKPQINGNTLAGNKTAADLGLVGAEQGKGLSTNDYTTTEKTKLAGLSNYDDTEVRALIASKADAEDIPTKTSDILNDSGFIQKTVNNLTNYYLKSQIYTKTEVDALIAAVKNGRFISVATLPTTDIDTKAIYLVPSADPQTSNIKDEYINLDGSSAGWELIGSTAIDLSGYVTDADLTTALADYTTTANLTTLLAAKQDTISDLATIRSGASAGASAYQKPATGIPKTDLASAVQTSLGKADSAVQDVSGKADKVPNATNGNFAGLDSNGNLTDSGSKASDFLPSNTPIPDEVTANPQGTATGTLTKLGIGSDIYDIPSGGGSSTFAGLSDVQFTNLQDGQIPYYDATLQKWVNYSALIPPNGKTVTPTDDIQIWLNCAKIWDKTYTTINEVLADSTTLLALISSNNAADYMKRSTTWASSVVANSTAMTDIGANDYCADALLDDSTWRTAICNSTYFESVLNVKVPTMTSDTAPSGIVTADGEWNSGYAKWKAFNPNQELGWLPTVQAQPQDSWIQYQFTTNVKINKLSFKQISTPSTRSFKLQGSNDGSSYTDIATVNMSSTNDWENAIIANVNKYNIYKIQFVSSAASMGSGDGFKFQFYGRA